MRFSRKPKVDEGLKSDGQKWVLAMISVRAPLKPIHTLKKGKESSSSSSDDEESYSTTPTREEAKIKSLFSCPPAPRKPKPRFKCNNGRSAREFFTPPDLESAFICHVERERPN